MLITINVILYFRLIYKMWWLVVTLIIVVIVDFTGGQYPECAICPDGKYL